MTNPRFAGLKFPDMSRPETLQNKYLGKLSKRALGFMRSLLVMEPKDRLNSQACLDDIYFESLVQEQQGRLGTTIPPVSAAIATNVGQQNQQQQGQGSVPMSGVKSGAMTMPAINGALNVSGGSGAGGSGGVSNSGKLLQVNPSGQQQQTQMEFSNSHLPASELLDWHTQQGSNGASAGAAGATAGTYYKDQTQNVLTQGQLSPRSQQHQLYMHQQHQLTAEQQYLQQQQQQQQQFQQQQPPDLNQMKAETPDGAPSSRQKSRKGREKAPGVAGGADAMSSNGNSVSSSKPADTRDAKEKEKERLKELEKEAERERERIREKEIRAFREFSTTLPIKQTRRSRGASFVQEQQEAAAKAQSAALQAQWGSLNSGGGAGNMGLGMNSMGIGGGGGHGGVAGSYLSSLGGGDMGGGVGNKALRSGGVAGLHPVSPLHGVGGAGPAGHLNSMNPNNSGAGYGGTDMAYSNNVNAVLQQQMQMGEQHLASSIAMNAHGRKTPRAV
eukprot:gene28220-31878_t